jgi:hypothetical protein
VTTRCACRVCLFSKLHVLLDRTTATPPPMLRCTRYCFQYGTNKHTHTRNATRTHSLTHSRACANSHIHSQSNDMKSYSDVEAETAVIGRDNQRIRKTHSHRRHCAVVAHRGSIISPCKTDGINDIGIRKSVR